MFPDSFSEMSRNFRNFLLVALLLTTLLLTKYKFDGYWSQVSNLTFKPDILVVENPKAATHSSLLTPYREAIHRTEKSLDPICSQLLNASFESEFVGIDLVAENEKVDKLSPLLTSTSEVIHHAQNIHRNIFKTLIGKYKYAMIFGLAPFENKGDSAISAGELILLEWLGIKIIYFCVFRECSNDAIKTALAISKNYTNDELVILLQGGGTLMCYTVADHIRDYTITLFKNFEIVMFPQSLWIREDQTKQRMDYYKHVYSLHPRLTFTYRDRDSFERGKVFFPNARPLLAPDMAFQLGAFKRTMLPTHNIVWLLRMDMESQGFDLPSPSLVKLHDICFGDWKYWSTTLGMSHIENIFLLYTNGLTFLQRGRVVITERLHGHILSVLLGIPHVVIDPINHKASTYINTWTAGLTNVLIANSSKDALNKALLLLDGL